DIKIKDSKIVVLKSKLEKIINEKDALETKIKKFENASQSLNKLIGSQVTDNSKKGLGYVNYNDVPPPHTRRFSPPRIDLSHTGLPEFAEPSVQSYGVKPIEVVTQKSSVKISALVKENNGTPLIEDCKSDEEDLVDSPSEKERKIVEPGVDKARCKYHQKERMVNETNHSRVNHNANTVPKAMLTRTDLKPDNSIGPVNLKETFKGEHHTITKTFSKRANKGKAIKTSACWVWRPIKLDRNISYLTNFKEFDEGYVAFGGGAKGGKITSKRTIRTAKLDFKDVYFFKEL
nr:hypothetical protein [Tanacetum cinerariifolium]